MGRKSAYLDEKVIIDEYVSSVISIEKLGLKYHVGKLKIKEILDRNGVPSRKAGGQSLNRPYKLSDWRVVKYPESCDGYHYEAVSKSDKMFRTKDYMNAAGVLTSYISKKFGVEIPTLYDRREYYKLTGDYWWEQYFDIVKVKDLPVKKCPYCDWATIDIDNKSGAYSVHLIKSHGINPNEYVREHPEESKYFIKVDNQNKRIDYLKERGNHITCPICGEHMKMMTDTHLTNKHDMTMSEFKSLYPSFKVSSDTTVSKLKMCAYKSNTNVSKKRFVSKYEGELHDFLNKNGIKFVPNRQILDGREIDILIEDKKLGIEFDGLYWHSEVGGKDHQYHLNKTKVCNSNGYGLIHIFEDEYVNHKEIVLDKLKHILKLSNNLPKVPGRKVIVKEIYKYDAENFLNKFHIQGFIPSTVYLGGFYNEELIAVMAFRNRNMKNPNWELVRYATDSRFKYQGVGGKLFSYFKKEYNPDIVVSFADRRWTIDKDDNLYTKLGFVLDSVTKPSYSYCSKNRPLKRQHKFNFRKEVLHKRYGFPMTMTEGEMTKELGFYRIWDCGLFKYVWRRDNLITDFVSEG